MKLEESIDDVINGILDEYRKCFDKGCIPNEHDLRVALYSKFGPITVTSTTMTVSDCSGNTLQVFNITDDGYTVTKTKA